MQKVWLRYQIGAAPVVSMRVQTLGVKDTLESEIATGRTLRRRIYTHTLSKRTIWSFQIGARELWSQGTVEPFLELFWGASRHWLSLSTSATTPPDNEFTEVSIEGGTAPKEYVEDHLLLPTWSLVLTQTEPA